MTALMILVEANPRDAATGAAVPVRLAGGGAKHAYHYEGAHYRAGIAGLPTIIQSLDFEGGELGTGGVPGATELRWGAARSADLAALAALYWIDAAITIRIGPEGSYPPATLTGRVLEATAEGGTLKIALADPAAELKKPFPVARWLGTGGLEGPAEWEGGIKRRLFGRVWNVRGEPIDVAHNIYAYADPARPCQAFDAVRDMGVPAAALTVLAWQGSMAATFAALQAAAAPQGGGVVCPSIACIKWWTRPAGDLTADIKGEVGGGYVETSAEIAERIVQAAGGAAFAPATVAAAKAARPAPVGWVIAGDTSATSSMLDELLGNSSLLWILSGAGQIVLRQWAWGAPVATAQSHEATRQRVFKPLATRKLGYKRNETQMARGDIAAVMLAADVTYADGTPVESLKPADAAATRGAPAGTPVAGVAAETLVATANAAQAQAVQSSVDAADAQLRIQKIVANDMLDKSEKPGEVAAYNGLIAEQAGIEQSATNYNITTEKAAYTAAIAALTAYLTGLSPTWSDANSDTPIVRATYDAKFAAVYATRSTLRNKIAQIAGEQASVDANGNLRGDGTNVSNALVAHRFTGATANYSVLGNGLKNINGSWGEVVFTEDSYVNGAAVAGTLVSGYMIMGLSSANSGVDSNGIDYRLYRYVDAGEYLIGWPGMSWAGTGVSIGANDRVSIRYDNGKVRYYINGNQVYAVDAPPGKRFYGAFVGGYSTGEIKNIEFTPYSDNVSAAALVANKLTNIGSSNVIIEGNTIRREAGNDDYNACVRGEPMAGGCYAEILMPSSGWAMMSLDGEASGTYYADQRIMVQANGGWWGIYMDGSFVTNGTAPAPGQPIRIAYDNTGYQLLLNGAAAGSKIAAPSGRTHYAKYHSYNGPNIRISGVGYGPYTDNDWASTGGSNRPADNATNDRYLDTRNDNQPPSWYLANYNVRKALEFKHSPALDVPGAVSGAFGALETTVDYADLAGGAIKQRFTFGAGQTGAAFVRVSTGASAWGAWQKDYSGFARPAFGESDLLESGSTVATLSNFKTSQGISAGFVNQGPGATAAANRVLNDRIENGVLHIAQPDGGTALLGGNQTGQIQIVLPYGYGSYSMLRFDVVVSDLAGTAMATRYTVAGYLYTNNWEVPHATAIGPRGSTLPVKFGAYNGKAYIWIGNVETPWYYAAIKVENLTVRYSTVDMGWASGWSVSMNNGDISSLVTATVPIPRAGDAVFGEGVFEAAGGATATLANFKTIQGISAGFVGQGVGATANNLAQLDPTAASQLTTAVNGGSVSTGVNQVRTLLMNAGASIAYEAQLLVDGGGSGGNVQLRVEWAPADSGSWSTIATHTGNYAGPGEPGDAEGSGNWTNNTGLKQRIDFRMVRANPSVGGATRTGPTYLRI